MVRADESFLVAGDGFSCTENFSNQDVWELTDNLSWFQGRHQLTFGTHTELIRTERLTLIQPLGHWDFASLDSLEQGLPEAYFRTLPNPALPEVPAADLGINQVGLYAQDQWGATSSLTLTAGLRMDVPFFTSSPIGNPLLGSELGIDNSLTPSGNILWSPRLGFSYDLAGRGFLRGGVGLFSGRPAYHWISSVYGNTGLDASTLFCAGSDVPAFTLDPAGQPTTCGGGPVVPTSEVNYFDPAFRFPRSLRVALGTDLRLPWGMVGTVDLLYVRGVNQFYLNDVNLAPTGAAAAEGGRVLYGSHDPATGDGTPNRRSAAFGPVIQVRNSSGDRSYVATVQFQKRFAGGAELSVGYTYTDSKDRLSAAADIASLNFARINPLDGTLEQRRLAHLDVQRAPQDHPGRGLRPSAPGPFLRVLQRVLGRSLHLPDHRGRQRGRSHGLRRALIQRPDVRAQGRGRHHPRRAGAVGGPGRLHPEQAVPAGAAGAATATEQLPRPLGLGHERAALEGGPHDPGAVDRADRRPLQRPEPPRPRLGGPAGHSRHPHPGAGGIRRSERAGDLRLRDPGSQCP